MISIFEANRKNVDSIDTITDQDQDVDISTKNPNYINPSGLSPKKLDLKISASIILV